MKAPQSGYPLQWPTGKARTPEARRKGGNFRAGRSDLSMADATKRVRRELDKITGAFLPVLSTNVELRLDGFPRSNQRKPEDPGAALYFQLHGSPIVLACDTYDTVEQNVAAIAAHLTAVRAIERYGVGTLDELFKGFAALPPAISPDDWREPLGNPQTLAEAEASYRDRMKYAHPDTGGNETVAAKLNAAIAAARRHWGNA